MGTLPRPRGVDGGGLVWLRSRVSMSEIIDLSSVMDLRNASVLNSNDSIENVLVPGKAGNMSSDCDEQILLTIPFQLTVRVHSVRFRAPDGGVAPATVKFFIDNASIGFDEAESDPPTQLLELDEDMSTTDGPPISLNFVKFQRVNLLTIFIQGNVSDGEQTVLDSLTIFGNTKETTDMKNLKKVG